MIIQLATITNREAIKYLRCITTFISNSLLLAKLNKTYFIVAIFNTLSLLFSAFSSADSQCIYNKKILTPEARALTAHFSGIGFDCKAQQEIYSALNLPLINIDNFEYEGGFRISAAKYSNNPSDSESNYDSADFSYGIFTYNQHNNSIYLIGNPRHGSIAEFKVPEIIKSTDVADFKVAKQATQNFLRFYTQGEKKSKELTGILNYFRVTGLAKIGNSLIVNYINWYDANASETDTSIVIKQANRLASSEIIGPYQIQGSAHASGWMTPIPDMWKSILGGSYIVGNQPYASILSRLSIGPSAFSFYPRSDMIYAASGKVPTKALLDFPLKHLLYDKSVYSANARTEDILANTNKKNKLWTTSSGAAVGFILPGTRTYVTIGKSAGHYSGIGYKITDSKGKLCGGPCPYDADDYYAYYWLWDVSDLVKVKYGLMKSYEVRPYDYGIFNIPIPLQKNSVSSGSYDPVNKRLYLSVRGGDTIGRYARPPLIITYKSKY